MSKSRDQLSAYAREYRAKNLEKKRAYEKEYYEKNPDKAKEKRRKYNANWLAKNPNANRNKHYKKRYGITVEDYETMSKQQNHLCAICGLPETKKRRDGTTSILAVDHDHTTGKVRQLLCAGCNHMLGNIENKQVSLDVIAAYIKRHSEITSD